jgi:hypothetical protein
LEESKEVTCHLSSANREPVIVDTGAFHQQTSPFEKLFFLIFG